MLLQEYRRKCMAYVIDQTYCVGCRTCVQACPFGAIENKPDTLSCVIIAERCKNCGICSKVCPTQVIAPEEKAAG